ncbi:family 5 glycoside hydrolase, partial [Imleria badia]
GFNEVTTASGDYYQLWNGSTPTINYGLTGLENFDNVVAATKANDNCLIVTLGTTSIDYEPHKIRSAQITSGQPHDYFYANPEVIIYFFISPAYQNYVKVWIERYIDESTIFGWE